MEQFGALEVDQELLLDKLTFKICIEAALGWIAKSVAQDRRMTAMKIHIWNLSSYG